MAWLTTLILFVSKNGVMRSPQPTSPLTDAADPHGGIADDVKRGQRGVGDFFNGNF